MYFNNGKSEAGICKKYIEDDYKGEIIKAEKVDRSELEESWISMGETHWADKMKQYLTCCISNLDLHQL